MIYFLGYIIFILSLITTFGLFIFQIFILKFKRTDLSFYLLLSFFFSFVMTVVVLNLSSVFELNLIFYSTIFLVLVNHVLTFLTTKKLIRNKNSFLPTDDKELRIKNRFVLIFYILTVFLYYSILYIYLVTQFFK